MQKLLDSSMAWASLLASPRSFLGSALVWVFVLHELSLWSWLPTCVNINLNDAAWQHASLQCWDDMKRIHSPFIFCRVWGSSTLPTAPSLGSSVRILGSAEAESAGTKLLNATRVFWQRTPQTLQLKPSQDHRNSYLQYMYR